MVAAAAASARPVDLQPLLDVIQSEQPATVAAPLTVGDGVVVAGTEDGATDSSLAALSALAATAAATAATSTDLQPFLDADPTDRFVTPASGPMVMSPHDPMYGSVIETIEEAVELLGTDGFSRRVDGTLTYANNTSEDVALLWTAPFSEGPQEFIGILVVRPGTWVVVPADQDAFVIAQHPKLMVDDGFIIRLVAVAGPGHPAPATPGTPPRIPIVDSDYQWIREINNVIGSREFNSMVDLGASFSSLLGLNVINKVLSAISAIFTGGSVNLVASIAKGIQNLGTSILEAGATMASARTPIGKWLGGGFYVVGAVVTTWAYLAEQASYVKPAEPSVVMDYIKKDPVGAVGEVVQATGKVAWDLGVAAVGALGRLLTPRPYFPFL